MADIVTEYYVFARPDDNTYSWYGMRDGYVESKLCSEHEVPSFVPKHVLSPVQHDKKMEREERKVRRQQHPHDSTLGISPIQYDQNLARKNFERKERREKRRRGREMFIK